MFGIINKIKAKYIKHTNNLIIQDVKSTNKCPFCKSIHYSINTIEGGEMFYCFNCERRICSEDNNNRSHNSSIKSNIDHTNSINSEGKVSGRVLHHVDGKNSVELGDNSDFITILTSSFIIFADHLKENDKITFVKWANLSLSPWSQLHREKFALALMHHLLESKETAALIPEALKGATESISSCSLPPLDKPLTNEMRRLFNLMFSTQKQEKN